MLIVLLAAAPTTPPCFRHWRRSSSLLGIFSGKMIYDFGTPERLRTLRCTLFTGRGVKGNGCCLCIGKIGKKCLHLGSFDDKIKML